MPRKTKHALTVEVLEAAGQFMLTQEEIGALHNISGERVCQILKERPEFREAYERGKATCTAGLRKKAIEMAMDGNVTAIIWATKNVIGWADRNETKSERTVEVRTRYVAGWGRRSDELGDDPRPALPAEARAALSSGEESANDGEEDESWGDPSDDIVEE